MTYTNTSAKETPAKTPDDLFQEKLTAAARAVEELEIISRQPDAYDYALAVFRAIGLEPSLPEPTPEEPHR